LEGTTNILKSKIERNLLNLEKLVVEFSFSVDPPDSIIPKQISDKFDILQWDPLELARQMTLIEYRAFKKIKPKECFNSSWTKPNKLIESPNIVELTERFNILSYWFATFLLNEEDLKQRSKIYMHILKIIVEAEIMHNFNLIVTLNSVFGNAAVHRLKKTQELVPPNLREKQKEIANLVSQTNSFKNLRAALVNVQPPTIPYLGVFLTDLIFIEEGSTNKTKNGLINFAKRRLYADVLLKIQTLQQSPYNFREVPELQTVLQDLKDIKDDDYLYNQSLKVEPRENK